MNGRTRSYDHEPLMLPYNMVIHIYDKGYHFHNLKKKSPEITKYVEFAYWSVAGTYYECTSEGPKKIHVGVSCMDIETGDRINAEVDALAILAGKNNFGGLDELNIDNIEIHKKLLKPLEFQVYNASIISPKLIAIGKDGRIGDIMDPDTIPLMAMDIGMYVSHSEFEETNFMTTDISITILTNGERNFDIQKGGGYKEVKFTPKDQEFISKRVNSHII